MPWTVLIALTFASFATVTMEMLPSGLLPQIGRGLAVDPALAGTLVTAWALTIVVTGVPLVRVTAGVRRTRLIPAALGVVAIAGLVTASAPSFGVALAGRVLAAAGHGVFWALIVVHVADTVAPERLGRALAIVLSGPTIAGCAGLPVATALVDTVGWRGVFAGASVVSALVAGALVPILADTETSGPRPRSVIRWDRSAILCLGTALAAALVLVGHFVLFTYVSLVVTDVAGFDSGAVAAVLVLFGAAGAIGVAISGWLSDRWPSATLPVSAFAALTAFAMLAAAPAVPAVFVTTIVLWGTVVGVLPAAMQVRVLRLASPEFRPAAGSVVVTVLNLGIAGGAALGGLTVGFGVAELAPVAAVVTSVGALCLSLSARVPARVTE